jgi:MFS family permease
VRDEASAPILRHRPFALFWVARIASTVAYHMFAVAVGWQIYALTDSALALGLIGLVQFVPMMLLTLSAGQAADRYDRRLVIAVCQAAEGAAVAALTLGTLSGAIGEAGIFALVALIAAARAFESPTMAALVPNLVPRALVPRASAWSASANQTAQIVGPALGGLLYGLGPGVVYGAATGLFLLAAALIAAVPLERTVRSTAVRGLGALFAGAGFVLRDKVILGTISLDLFAVLLGGATALLPIFARDILGTGPWGWGSCARRPPAARSRCRWCWRTGRWRRRWGRSSSPRSSSSASRPASSRSRPRSGSPSRRFASSAPPTSSASSSASRWCSSGRPTRCAGG